MIGIAEVFVVREVGLEGEHGAERCLRLVRGDRPWWQPLGFYN